MSIDNGHVQTPAKTSLSENGSHEKHVTIEPKSGPEKPEEKSAPSRGWRFWAVFPPICLATLLIALESTVTTASLPKIASDLDAGDNYVWIMNGYLLTASVYTLFWNWARLSDVSCFNTLADFAQHGLYSFLRPVRIRLRPALAYPFRCRNVYARQWYSWWCRLYGYARWYV